MGKKLLEKAGLILGPHTTTKVAPPAAPAPVAAFATEVPRAKTAPGAMLQFMSAQSGTLQEVEDLRERVKAFEGATPVRELNPADIAPSKWANRHQDSFADAEFLALRDEIREAGGVVQPIKVRPLRVLNGSTPEADKARYEVVFGHRRHRACLELGLPVLALVEDVSDQDLFQQMERENRQRKNLSAWEQGCMYRQAIDGGLYPSLRRLAEAIDVDVSLVSKAVALARLPEGVISAFASPLDIQFRWAAALSEVVQKDPEGVLARAREITGARGGQLAPAQVFAALSSARTLETPRGPDAPSSEIYRDGRKVAVLSVDRSGRYALKFERGVLSEARRKDLIQTIESFLK